MSKKDTYIAALKQAGWTDDDVCLLRYALAFDQKIPYESVLQAIGHCAEAHDNLIAAEALVALLKFTAQSYDGICRARFVNKMTEGEIGEKAKFYHEKLAGAEALCEAIKSKHDLVKSLAKQQPMESKGTIH